MDSCNNITILSIVTNAPHECKMLIIGGAVCMLVGEEEVYRNSLFVLRNCSINLKLL